MTRYAIFVCACVRACGPPEATPGSLWLDGHVAGATDVRGTAGARQGWEVAAIAVRGLVRHVITAPPLVLIELGAGQEKGGWGDGLAWQHNYSLTSSLPRNPVYCSEEQLQQQRVRLGETQRRCLRRNTGDGAGIGDQEELCRGSRARTVTMVLLSRRARSWYCSTLLLVTLRDNYSALFFFVGISRHTWKGRLSTRLGRSSFGNSRVWQ